MHGSIKVQKTIKSIQMRKDIKIKSSIQIKLIALMLLGMVTCFNELIAQDSTAAAPVKVVKAKGYVKNTFEGNFILDNQTVMVPIKGTLEATIQHRFGIVTNGFQDLCGIFSGANMRLGVNYAPVKNLQFGFGATNDRMQVDFTAKLALLKQTKDNKMPVSVTFFGNALMDTRQKNSALPIVNFSDRMAYFSQLIIARKICDRFSIQVAPSISYFNNVPAYFDDKGNVQPAMENAHVAIAFSGKVKLTEGTSLLLNYDQPLTQHAMYNPHPNLSLGFEFKTSGHDFQIFGGNFGFAEPEDNNAQNTNDFTKGQWLIGFNISRLWNF